MRRVMTEMFGIDVVLVMGITDIDDKIIRRANEVHRVSCWVEKELLTITFLLIVRETHYQETFTF